MNLTLISAQADARWNRLCGGVTNRPATVFGPVGASHPVWLGGTVLAVCAALLMLWMFHGVVSTSVVQGEARRATAAQHELAAWHCARSGGRAASDSCVAQIGSPALGPGGLPR